MPSYTDPAPGAENIPNLEEDENSPLTGSGAQTHTITLSGTYDRVLVFVQALTNTAGTSQAMEIRFNGASTADYDYTLEDGTRTTGDTGVQYTTSHLNNATISGQFTLEEGDAGEVTLKGPFGEGFGSSNVATARVGAAAATHPVSSITFAGASGTIAVKARVYGWDGEL